jgi:Tol biopolymer transport system component
LTASPIQRLNAALAGRYVVEREIGQGGMSTVYLARDVRHRRPVALKVLLPELAAVLGTERFLSEISVTASLQHPHLLPLFDSGEAGGLLYYSMPYVDGESLRRRLERERQLPIDEAVRIGVSIAGALDYAHRRGVIHRDLKPENILLADGQPVVADFGIALAVSRAGGSRITQTGLSLGTPQYMSPEQATGDRDLDGRSDVYSLGAVVYEMLTGDPPHTGSTSQAVIARVVTEVPRSMRSARPTVPEHVDAAVRHALEKVPADRFATAQEFADALEGKGAQAWREGALAGVSHATLRARWRSGPRGRRLLGATAVTLLLAGGLFWFRAREGPVVSLPAKRFALAVPTEQMTGGAVISPDGRTIAFAGRTELGAVLYLRRLDELRMRPLAGTEGASAPFFSPDGEWLGYVADGKLKRVPVAGGTPITLVEPLQGDSVRSSSPPSCAGGNVVFANSSNGLSIVSAAGGPAQRLTTPDSSAGEVRHRSPRLLKSGRAIVFVVRWRDAKPDELALADVDRGRRLPIRHTRLGVPASRPLGLFGDWLLYSDSEESGLYAVRLDISGRRVRGTPVRVLDDPDGRQITSPSLSDDGTLVYRRPSSSSVPVLVDATGAERALVDRAQSDDLWRGAMHPSLSPDGRRLAFQARLGSDEPDIWIYDLSLRTLTKFTTVGGLAPMWTADGRRVLFVKRVRGNRSGTDGVWWQTIDERGPPQQLLDADGARVAVIAPGGRAIVYHTVTHDLWWAPLGVSLAPRSLMAEPFEEMMPRLSPDGHTLAYVSGESGGPEVYVRPFPSSGPRVRVSKGGGAEPVWSRDGRRLFFRGGGWMMAAGVTSSPTVAVAAPEPLFRDVYDGRMDHVNYDVSPDGRFLMFKPLDDVAELVVALNWTGELRGRLAAVR